MTARVLFQRVSVRGFRNIVALELDPAARINVIAGDNGQGKTSLLEALYFVATSKSFRAERLKQLICEGGEQASVRAELSEDAVAYEQRATLSPAGRSLLLDGKRANRIASYVVRTPVVVFHPGDLELASGAAAARRTLLDRVALFVDPKSGDDRQRYLRALRERQHVLETRGVRASELDAFEELMAEYGSSMQRARGRAAEVLIEALEPAFAAIVDQPLALVARHRPGGSENRQEFTAVLKKNRAADLRRGGAIFGPQRDELELELEGRSARHHASQGQQRLLTLALKLAELDCVRRARGAHPILLLDDVSSELDSRRTGAVTRFLQQTQGQVFVTTTRPELFVDSGDRRDFTLREGALIGG